MNSLYFALVIIICQSSIVICSYICVCIFSFKSWSYNHEEALKAKNMLFLFASNLRFTSSSKVAHHKIGEEPGLRFEWIKHRSMATFEEVVGLVGGLAKVVKDQQIASKTQQTKPKSSFNSCLRPFKNYLSPSKPKIQPPQLYASLSPKLARIHRPRKFGQIFRTTNPCTLFIWCFSPLLVHIPQTTKSERRPCVWHHMLIWNQPWS